MKPRIAIPEGDPGGIGPEVALQSLASPAVRATLSPLLVGHQQTFMQVAERLDLPLTFISVESAEEGFALAADHPRSGGADNPLPVLELEAPVPTEPLGQPAASFGLASVEAVLRAGALCKGGIADAMVTPPIHKESMHMAGYPYEGQTQILGELSGGKGYGMLACNGNLKVLLATRHMALRDAIERMEITLVEKQLRVAHEAARRDLGLENPRVALAGLNPHAGEGGAFGNEEKKILLPAIQRTKEAHGYETAGPLVPDVIFAEGVRGDWDIIVALYHDQAFIPLKLLGREKAWTLLVGADGILRTSPMHGAAYDIAGHAKADEAPFTFALAKATELVQTKSLTSK